jgi:hypothetical protein
VDEPVDRGYGNGLVAEGLAPGGGGLAAGDDERRPLVAAVTSENIRLAAGGSKGM